MSKIPITVVVVTKNEEAIIARCLSALDDFDEVILVDSMSSDKTIRIAEEQGVRAVSFEWNGSYPKKRQWCLDYLDIKHDWVFWVDADEVVPSVLVHEMRELDFRAAGYFVKGQYVWNDKVLRYGLRNNKIALFHKKRMRFPEIDDLDCPGMGEIEGHYQPVIIEEGWAVGSLSSSVLHYANFSQLSWNERHVRYARWEACMIQKNAFPVDPIWWRDFLKRVLRCSFSKPFLMFFYSYIVKRGFLDGFEGYDFAIKRKRYYDMVLRLCKK